MALAHTPAEYSAVPPAQPAPVWAVLPPACDTHPEYADHPAALFLYSLMLHAAVWKARQYPWAEKGLQTVLFELHFPEAVHSGGCSRNKWNPETTCIRSEIPGSPPPHDRFSAAEGLSVSAAYTDIRQHVWTVLQHLPAAAAIPAECSASVPACRCVFLKAPRAELRAGRLGQWGCCRDPVSVKMSYRTSRKCCFVFWRAAYYRLIISYCPHNSDEKSSV